MFETLIIYLGLLKVLQALYAGVMFYIRNYSRKQLDLLARYGGEGTWAIVTGASDGIGAEFTRQLAKMGFNIVLVSRTESKLAKVADELKQINSKIQSKILVKDFYGNANVEFYEQIMTECKGLKIGLVVANAGVFEPGPFHEIDSSKIQSMLDVNVYQVAAMIKQFLPQLVQRQEENANIKSGIITVSSAIGNHPAPNCATYAASKSFVHFLTTSVATENPKTDVLLLEPGLTATKMPKGLAKTSFADSPVECVQGALRDLGQESISAGAKNADITIRMMHTAMFFIPPFVLRYFFEVFFKQQYLLSYKTEQKAKTN